MPATRLSPKQQAFVREYVKDWNGTQAAIRAGYAAEKGASVTWCWAIKLIANDSAIALQKCQRES